MIRDKATMYRMLSAGEFGNTIPQYFSVEAWKASGDDRRYEMWGVRSATVANHPACRLYCPADEVEAYAAKHFDTPNISMMVDAVAGVLAWLEVWDSPTGLVVEGILHPPLCEGWNWRNSMKRPERRKRFEGVVATFALRQVLNENSFDDLRDVLHRFPNHVVELSALNACIGSKPHRNAVVWEVRNY